MEPKRHASHLIDKSPQHAPDAEALKQGFRVIYFNDSQCLAKQNGTGMSMQNSADDMLDKFLKLPLSELSGMQEFIVNNKPIGLSRRLIGKDEDWIMACAEIGTVSTPNQKQIHRLMLRANNLWSGTQGSTLGLFGEDDAVVLTLSLRTANTTTQELVRALGQLALDAQRWQDNLHETRQGNLSTAV